MLRTIDGQQRNSTSERLSAQPLPASIGPRPEAEHYQRHPIPGQMQLGVMSAGYRESIHDFSLDYDEPQEG